MVLFKELLNAPDFGAAADELARGFRDTYSLPPIHQLGIVVPDVQQAAEQLEAMGMKPFFIAEGRPVSWHERSVPRSFSGKMGIAYHEGYEVELLEAGHGSDFYRNCIHPEDEMVVQHLGFVVKDVDAWHERLLAEGHPLWVRGRLRAGPATTDFAYMDTLAHAGIIIEFICWRFFGIQVTPPPGIFHTIGRIEKWTGRRCIAV